MFYLKVKSLDERTKLLEYLKQNEIWAVFHYVPLHSAPAGLKLVDLMERITLRQGNEKLMRLPMYFRMRDEEISQIVQTIINFTKIGKYNGLYNKCYQ